MEDVRLVVDVPHTSRLCAYCSSLESYAAMLLSEACTARETPPPSRLILSIPWFHYARLFAQERLFGVDLLVIGELRLVSVVRT